mgnify:CR=1 FL=1
MSENSKVQLKFTDFPSLLEEIRKRPQMYLGGEQRSLELLAAYLGGFDLAELFHELPVEKRMGNFDWGSFEEWVRNEYNPRRLSRNSFGLAIHLSESQTKSFDLWFSWYDLFRSCCRHNN